MRKSFQVDKRTTAVIAAVVAVVFVTVLLKSGSGQTANSNPPPAPPAASTANEASVDLTQSQLNSIKIETLGTHSFSVEKTAVGNIDYDEDLTVQVFSSYPGKITAALASLGDDVKKGQPLYTIESPDLIQAESTLISTAATYDMTSKELARARSLLQTNGVSERELEQATSDEQAAEGALKASRDAVRVFGKSDAEIDQVLATRKIDSALVVSSPLTGRVIARNAQAGLLVQPGIAPAPYAVADLAKKWMVANVIESDSPMLRVGQPLRATLMAYPGRVFNGRISRLGASVDPNTHRIMVRCEIADPQDELRPGMLASFAIQVQPPVESVAIPMNGVVRNGDGTMAAWVTTDRHHFVQRLIKIGLQQDGLDQVLDGLQSNDLAVTDGAIFLNNILYAPPDRLESARCANSSPGMLKSIIAFCLSRRAIVLFALLAFAAAGYVCFRKLNIEAYPNPTPVILEITAQAPGLSAEEMEKYYTTPIEIGLYTTPGIDVIRSTSFYGLSFIRVVFKYGIDYHFAYAQADIAIQQNVTLPGNQTPVIQQNSSTGEIYRYQVVGPKHFGLTDLRTVQDWIVLRRLSDHSRHRPGQQLGRHNQGIRCRGQPPKTRSLQCHRAPNPHRHRQRQYQRRRPRNPHRPAIHQHSRRRFDR